MKPEHIRATTMHRRLGTESNSFSYGVDYVLTEPERHEPASRLFSVNAANLAAIHDVDHGGERDNGRGAAWVRECLATEGLATEPGWRILLLAQPRLLGTRFTPVSFWMVVDEAEALRIVIAEVNNTFGDRHSYLCAHPDLAPIRPEDEIVARKVFHVSPFQPVAGVYRFRFGLTPESVTVRIDYRHENGGLLATLIGKRAEMTSAGLVAALVRRPMGSVRVLALIHWQALRLWFKRSAFHSRPLPPAREVSR